MPRLCVAMSNRRPCDGFRVVKSVGGDSRLCGMRDVRDGLQYRQRSCGDQSGACEASHRGRPMTPLFQRCNRSREIFAGQRDANSPLTSCKPFHIH